MTIKIMHGDLLRQDDVDAIVNTVNCVGVMGKGIALQFRNKFPENYQAYKAACDAKEVKTGRMFVFDNGALARPHFVINFPTKNHWRGDSKLDFIRTGLADLKAKIRELNIRSIALPPLGCGNGGLDWNEVRPIIESSLSEFSELEVRLFEPGTPPAAKDMQVRTEPPRMTPGRAAILKVLDTYRALNYGLTKIEVQKLAYFLQSAGEDLKLSFVQHQFGPYSDQLRHVLNRMEGHYVRGVGDGTVDASIEPVPEALELAEQFITEQHHEALRSRVNRVAELIEGFQSPYGMELLATVHWVGTRKAGIGSATDALREVQRWSPRKRELMQASHVEAAWEQLVAHGWFQGTSDAAPAG